MLERTGSQRDNWLFAACMVLSVLALFAPPSWGAAVASSLRQTALIPFVWLEARGAEGRTSRARIQAATQQRDSLAELVRQYAPLATENDRLRTLLSLGERLGPGFVPAEVLRQTQPTDGRTLLLDAGAAEGISRFDPVITSEGLVGVIRDVSEHTSMMMTWAHPEFRVSATTVDGSVAGIAGPTAAAEASRTALEFRAVTYRDTVAQGTPVVASGLGGVYPRGVPIGTVAGVEREQIGWERVYRLQPAAHPAKVSHVLVLSRVARGRATQAFTPADTTRKAAPKNTPADTTRRAPPRNRPAPADTTRRAPATTTAPGAPIPAPAQ